MLTADHGTRLTLHIDLDADPIAGSLTTAAGISRRFSGWIGLAAALEAIRADRPAPPHDHATPRDLP